MPGLEKTVVERFCWGLEGCVVMGAVPLLLWQQWINSYCLKSIQRILLSR